MTIYEMYGRLLEEREQEHNRHLGTLALLRSIKNGQISIDDVEIKDDDSWQIIAKEPPPFPASKPTRPSDNQDQAS